MTCRSEKSWLLKVSVSAYLGHSSIPLLQRGVSTAQIHRVNRGSAGNNSSDSQLTSPQQQGFPAPFLLRLGPCRGGIPPGMRKMRSGMREIPPGMRSGRSVPRGRSALGRPSPALQPPPRSGDRSGAGIAPQKPLEKPKNKTRTICAAGRVRKVFAE